MTCHVLKPIFISTGVSQLSLGKGNRQIRNKFGTTSYFLFLRIALLN